MNKFQFLFSDLKSSCLDNRKLKDMFHQLKPILPDPRIPAKLNAKTLFGPLGFQVDQNCGGVIYSLEYHGSDSNILETGLNVLSPYLTGKMVTLEEDHVFCYECRNGHLNKRELFVSSNICMGNEEYWMNNVQDFELTRYLRHTKNAFILRTLTVMPIEELSREQKITLLMTERSVPATSSPEKRYCEYVDRFGFLPYSVFLNQI